MPPVTLRIPQTPPIRLFRPPGAAKRYDCSTAAVATNLDHLRTSDGWPIQKQARRMLVVPAAAYALCASQRVVQGSDRHSNLTVRIFTKLRIICIQFRSWYFVGKIGPRALFGV
jgi:hypothetical protein